MDSKEINLQGLIFTIDRRHFPYSNFDSNLDKLFDIVDPFFIIKEVDSSLINGTVVVTVEITQDKKRNFKYFMGIATFVSLIKTKIFKALQ